MENDGVELEEKSDPVYDAVTPDDEYVEVAVDTTPGLVVIPSATSTTFMAEDANQDGIPDDDLFGYPGHIRLNYNGAINEPTYFGSGKVATCFKPVSMCLRTWYDTIHIVTYYILSVVFGAVLAVVWGLVFGVVNFFTVWAAQPFIKLWFMLFRCMYMVSRVWVRMFCDPCFESMALALSKIRGNFSVDVKGLHKV